MRKNQFLKVKNSILELEKGFIELKDREGRELGEKQKNYFLNRIWCLQMIWISSNKKK